MFLITLVKQIERFTVQNTSRPCLCRLFYTFFLFQGILQIYITFYLRLLFFGLTRFGWFLCIFIFSLNNVTFLFTSTFAETQLGHKARFSFIFLLV